MMRSRLAVVAVLLLVLFVPVAMPQPSNRQEVIPVDDPAYAYLDLLRLEAGLPQPSAFRPYTAQEFTEYTDDIPSERLSTSSRRLLTLLRTRLEPSIRTSQDGTFGFSSGLQSSVEYYGKLHADSDYFFPRGERLPMLSVPLQLWFFDAVYADSVISLQEDYRLSHSRWEPITYTRGESDPAPVHGNRLNWFSLESHLLELDWYYPFRGLVSIGGPHWHLTYGRDAMNVGNGSTGNLFLSDFPDYYDSLILSTHWRFFKGTAAYVYFEPWLTADDTARLGSGEYFMRLRDYGLPYKALMLHLLEFRPFANLPRFPQTLVFVGEGLMFGSQYPQIRDFNPMLIFHNWFEYERSNDTFIAGFNVVPIPRVELYGQYHMQEFDTSYEDGGNFPGAGGWLAGTRGMFALPVGVLSGYAEYVHTDPLLYNRYHPLLKLITRRRIWSYPAPDQMIYVDKPIGYFAGSDTNLVSSGVSFRLPAVASAGVTYTYIAQGEKTPASPYEETPGEQTPTGTPQLTHAVQLSGEYSPLPAVSLGGSLYLISDQNVAHQAGTSRVDLQGTVHLTVNLGVYSRR